MSAQALTLPQGTKDVVTPAANLGDFRYTGGTEL